LILSMTTASKRGSLTAVIRPRSGRADDHGGAPRQLDRAVVRTAHEWRRQEAGIH
jgi:hypothetical protein